MPWSCHKSTFVLRPSLTESNLKKRLQRMWVVGVRIGVAACDWASQPAGAHPREKGSFPEYWLLREGVCRAPLTGRQEKFELRFVWLRR
jgi:hypothetical protein